MRQLALFLLFWLGLTAVAPAQPTEGITVAPPRMTRKERRALEREQREVAKSLAEAKAKRDEQRAKNGQKPDRPKDGAPSPSQQQ